MTPVLQGLVLAGGRSQRMGTDKALLRIGERTLLSRSVQCLQRVVSTVHISVRSAEQAAASYASGNVIVDRRAGLGPAAGLLTAHSLHPEAAWLVLAVDMPLVTTGVLAELVAAREPAADATAWRAAADGRPEPLCALYEPATLAALTAHVDEGGGGSLRRWLEGARVNYLTGTSSELLRSANTPEDFEQLRRRQATSMTNGKPDGR